MTLNEAQKAAELAGFTRLPLDDSMRAVFANGSGTLIVHSDGKWTCYGSASGIMRPDHYGDDLNSLQKFLGAGPER